MAGTTLFEDFAEADLAYMKATALAAIDRRKGTPHAFSELGTMDEDGKEHKIKGFPAQHSPRDV